MIVPDVGMYMPKKLSFSDKRMLSRQYHIPLVCIKDNIPKVCLSRISRSVHMGSNGVRGVDFCQFRIYNM